MTCAEAICAYVASLATTVSGRLFTPELPQQPEPSTLPCALVQQFGDNHDPHLRGTSNIKFTRIQIDTIGRSFKQAKTADQAILGTYSGGSVTGLRALGGVSQGGITFHRIHPQNYFEIADKDELHYQKRVVRDYLVWYSE